MKKLNKFKALLCMSAISILVISTKVNNVHAATTDYLTKGLDGKVNKYSLSTLQDSFEEYTNNPKSVGSVLFNDYAKNPIYAFLDDKRGYVEFQAAADAFLNAKNGGKSFDLDVFTESAPSTSLVKDLPTVINVASIGLDGKVVYTEEKTNTVQTLMVRSVGTINPIVVDYDTTVDKLSLPINVTVTLSDGTTDSANINWDTSKFIANQEGTQTLNGTLSVPNGKTWSIADSKKSITITINVTEGPLEVIGIE